MLDFVKLCATIHVLSKIPNALSKNPNSLCCFSESVVLHFVKFCVIILFLFALNSPKFGAQILEVMCCFREVLCLISQSFVLEIVFFRRSTVAKNHVFLPVATYRKKCRV